jgi:hypothetical protein
MGDNAAKGADQLKKAEKKLASWQIFGNKYEDAAELLEKARDPWALRQTGGATARHPPKQTGFTWGLQGDRSPTLAGSAVWSGGHTLAPSPERNSAVSGGRKRLHLMHPTPPLTLGILTFLIQLSV